MRIALMTNNYKPIMGGVPISIERLAKGLEAQGHQVTIFAPTYEEQEEEKNVFRYGTLLNHFVGGICLPNPFDRRIEKEFQENTYDLIHVHHPMMIGWTAVYLSRKYRIPLTFTYHTRYEQYLEYYGNALGKCLAPGMPIYLQGFMKHCDYIFAPTEGMKKYLTDVCKQDACKVGILPTGIEDVNFRVKESVAREIRKKYQAEDIPFLITVSRMASEKNVAFLLCSLAKLKEKYAKPFRMLMIGDGPQRLDLEILTRKLNLQDEVMFTGKIPNEEIAPYFKAADGFLFASKSETQGIVVLEAFAGETPVIAVKASGVEDLVSDGVNGILTEEKEEEYAEYLSCFLQHAEERDDAYIKMSQNAYRTALKFSEEAVARKAINHYTVISAAQKSTTSKQVFALFAR